MADMNPGQPLNPGQLAGVQGSLPNGFSGQMQVLDNVGLGGYFLGSNTSYSVPMDKAMYKSSDVPNPGQPLRTDYSNP